jgi:beta-glucosidase
MASTWNRDLIEEVGQALGRETRAKNCGMLLGPMVNLHRIPNGGRNYETFSEDPVLTGKMAAAIIRGIQSEGTAACIKSFACNNQQKEQKLMSSEVDPRTLREIYLKVFTIALAESAPWGVMTSYNAINGEYPSDSRYWLEDVLRDEMGYEDFVVSDWHSIQSDGALTSGVDMEMPGPGKTLTVEKIKAALEAGTLTREEIEKRALRVLNLHARCTPARLGMGPYSPPELDTPRHRELCRRVAEEACVLLKNERNLLPLQKEKLKRIAVIGPNANHARLGGGGSASVSPFYSVSPLQGIRELLGDAVEVVYAEGCSLGNAHPAIAPKYLTPEGGELGEGLLGHYYENEAFDQGLPPTAIQTDSVIDFSWGWASPVTGLPRMSYTIRWTGSVIPPTSGETTLTLSTQEGIARLWIDDELVIDIWSQLDSTNFEDSYQSRNALYTLKLTAGHEYKIKVEYRKTGARSAIHLGWELPDVADSIAEAVELAKSADAVICVGGISNAFEGGTHDRDAFNLPGNQESLIEQIVAANENTIVVLKNGTPVSFKGWSEKVPAILEAHYPGQEGGNAIARILFGEVNPSGRLADTIPNSWEEVPALEFYPGAEGKAPYAEGLMVGYRHYDASQTAPVYPFGFGLSYTEFEHQPPIIAADHREPNGGYITVDCTVQNTGSRAGKETVQCYLEFINPSPDRPPRQLLSFEKVELQPSESKTVSLKINYTDLLTYSTEEACWKLEYTQFRIATGAHSRDLKSVEFDWV